MQAQPTTRRKRARHKSVRNAPGIYFSENAQGRKVFEVRYYDSEGKRRYDTVGPRLDAAKARLAEITGSKLRGERVAPVGMTFVEAVESWRRGRNIRPGTVAAYESNLRLYVVPRFARVKVRDITKGDVAEWLAGLKRQDGREGPLSEGTRRLILTALDVVLEQAVEDNAITSNPCRQLKRRPTQGKLAPRILESGELDRILTACAPFEWLRPILLTAVLAALRLGEIPGLKWKDVDFDANLLHIRRQVGRDGQLGPTKSGEVEGGTRESKAATIPLLPELRKVLIEQRLACEHTEPNAPVFPNALGQHRHPRSIQRAFGKVRRYAGISDQPRQLRFHDLRHTAISRLANAPGAVLPQVQKFARHADLSTTLAYVHPIDGDEWAASASAALAGLVAQ